MGYWPSKIPCVLNVVLMIGYATIDGIIGGQVLSAVSGGEMTIIVGIVVVSVVCWIVAVFGMAVFHKYERYAHIALLRAYYEQLVLMRVMQILVAPPDHCPLRPHRRRRPLL